MLAIVVEAVVRIGKRALKNNALRLLAIAAFMGLFFLAIPFNFIVLGAALIGFIGAASGAEVFKSSGGHGRSEGKHSEHPGLLGDDLPERARPTMAWALSVSVVWLALCLVPVVALVLTLGTGNSLARSLSSLARWRWSLSAAPMPFSPMSLRAPSNIDHPAQSRRWQRHRLSGATPLFSG